MIYFEEYKPKNRKSCPINRNKQQIIAFYLDFYSNICIIHFKIVSLFTIWKVIVSQNSIKNKKN